LFFHQFQFSSKLIQRASVAADVYKDDGDQRNYNNHCHPAFTAARRTV